MKRKLLALCLLFLPACAVDASNAASTGDRASDAPDASFADAGTGETSVHFLETGRPVKVEGIPNYDVDITGKSAQLALNFVDKGALLATDHFLNASTPASLTTIVPGLTLDAVGLPPKLPGLTAQPISTMIDTFWGVTKDAKGLTLHDETLKTVAKEITDQIDGDAGAAQVQNLTVSIPTTGKLGVLAGAPEPDFFTGNVMGALHFDYVISRVHTTFNVQVDNAGVLGTLSSLASWSVDFDIRLVIDTNYTPGPCTFFNTTASAVTEFVSISPNNAAASVATALGNAFYFLEGKPANIFQIPAGQISGQGGAVDIGALTGLLGALGTTCAAEEVPLGFTQFVISDDPVAKTLTFRLTHPVDFAPAFVTTPPILTVDVPTLTVPQFSEVFAGSKVTVNGAFFPAKQSTDQNLVWTDTTSGGVTESIVQFEPLPFLTPVTTDNIARQPFDAKNRLTVTNLTPSTGYFFTVQDCDALTCTAPSLPLPVVTTAPTPPVTLLLQRGSASVNVGSVAADANGAFGTSIVVPASTTPGVYTLAAQVGGATVATTTITVVTPGQPLPPILEFYDPTTNALSPGVGTCGTTPCETVTNSGPVTVRGEGFAKSAVVVLAADAVGGPQQATATTDATGTFTASFSWSDGVGTHLLVASQTVAGKTVQASVTVNDQKLE